MVVGSVEVRSPRPDHVKYRVGQVIQHKLFGYRGVIIGWDAAAKVSKTFVSVVDSSVLFSSPFFTVFMANLIHNAVV